MEKERIVPIMEDMQALFSYGELGFPCEIFHDDIYKFHKGTINWHWQKELEISFIIKGSVELQILEERHIIKEGQGYVIFPDYMHRITKVLNEEGIYDTIYVNPEFIFGKQRYNLYQKYYMSAYNSIKKGVFFFSVEEEWGARLLKELKEVSILLAERQSYYEIDVNIKMLGIWKIILNNIEDRKLVQRSISKNVESKIRTMINFIKANYDRKIYLDDIAFSAKIGKAECSRLFKAYLCTTPIKYLMEYRVEQSVGMIINGNQSITEIALEVGFNSINHYIDTFKKITGVTPYKLRLLNENKIRNNESR